MKLIGTYESNVLGQRFHTTSADMYEHNNKYHITLSFWVESGDKIYDVYYDIYGHVNQGITKAIVSHKILKNNFINRMLPSYWGYTKTDISNNFDAKITRRRSTRMYFTFPVVLPKEICKDRFRQTIKFRMDTTPDELD